METVRPLHIRVAEALGWTEFEFSGWAWLKGERGETIENIPIHEDSRSWRAFSPWQVHKEHAGQKQSVPHYDTDWDEIGPLIEQYRIDLSYDSSRNTWRAVPAYGMPGSKSDTGPGIPVAACELILRLVEAGKLKGVQWSHSS